MTINESTIKIGIWYVQQFEQDNQKFIEFVVRYKVIRGIMVMVYRALIIENQIPKIESISPEQKINFWNDAKEFAAGRLNNNECIELAKTLFVLKYL